MARKNELDAVEEERMNLIRQEQIALGKRLTRPVSRKVERDMPGEVFYKKRLAIIRKISEPGISYEKISAELGESRNTVKNWFAEPDVQEEYQYILEHISGAALKSIQTYALEAVHALVTLMRFGSEKYIYDASIAILDRAGVPKVSKIETIKEENTNLNWNADNMTEILRNLTDEQKEEAASGIEQLMELLSKGSNDA